MGIISSNLKIGSFNGESFLCVEYFGYYDDNIESGVDLPWSNLPAVINTHIPPEI